MSCFRDIHPDLWQNYQDACHKQLREFEEKSRILRAAEEEKTKPQPDIPYVVGIVPVADEPQSDDIEQPGIDWVNLDQVTGPQKGLYFKCLEAEDKLPRRQRWFSDPSEYSRHPNQPGFVHDDHSICDEVLNMEEEQQHQQGLDQDSLGQPGAAQSPSSSDVPFPASADQGTDPGPSTSTGGT
jgi:hypothetical protein